jgi:UDP-N-acetylglucosamine 2-epimerase (non-hydrolysing)
LAKQARICESDLVATLHRPANVDNPDRLAAVVAASERIAANAALVLPLHPRPRERLKTTGLLARLGNMPQLCLLPPLGYIEFMSAVSSARFVLTDSGGVQEETTYPGIPCLTLRDTTERPITVTEGSNRLVKLETLDVEISKVLSGPSRIGHRPDLWDGHTADRVVQSLRRHIAIEVSP